MPLFRALLALSFATACVSGVRAPVTSTDADVGLGLDSLRCAAVDGVGHCTLYGVSLYELIARPEVFHGRRVRVIGFAHFEFEGDGLYVHREDWERSISMNGLWIHPPSTGADSLNNHYLLVEGRFNAKMRGHFGMWGGSLDSVTRYEIWDRPHSPLTLQILPPPDRH